MSARMLVIMGSGETAPTMREVHASALARLSPASTAVLLDTPYGFQENAADISARAVEYFATSVGATLSVASWRSRDEPPLVREQALAAIRDADYVFAGPGSPTYALRQWQDTPLPGLLADKLDRGGCITFSSAAALTLGAATVPVYEVYKAGEAPVWREGLDLLGRLGLRVAVIPHYDNSEGGTHDTRYCYLGERRLRAMEDELDPETFVLGVDEHTALVLDLDAGSAQIRGRGGVTVRRAAGSRRIEAGTTVGIEQLRPDADADGTSAVAPSQVPGSGRTTSEPATSPLLEDTDRLATTFREALAAADATRAVGAALELDQLIVDYAADTLQSDELDRARATLRDMIVRLGDAAGQGLVDPATRIAPYVSLLLDEREQARQRRDFARADRLRDALTDAGITVRDTPDGSTWELV